MRELYSLLLIRDVQAKEDTCGQIPVCLDVKRPPYLLKSSSFPGPTRIALF